MKAMHAFLEKCSWEMDPDMKPSMCFKHNSEESFAQFISSLNLQDVRKIFFLLGRM